MDAKGEELFSERSAFVLKERIVRETSQACEQLGIEESDLSIAQANELLEEMGYVRPGDE